MGGDQGRCRQFLEQGPPGTDARVTKAASPRRPRKVARGSVGTRGPHRSSSGSTRTMELSRSDIRSCRDGPRMARRGSPGRKRHGWSRADKRNICSYWTTDSAPADRRPAKASDAGLRLSGANLSCGFAPQDPDRASQRH